MFEVQVVVSGDLAAHGALVLGLLGAQPLHDAVDVEAVGALAPHLGVDWWNGGVVKCI